MYMNGMGTVFNIIKTQQILAENSRKKKKQKKKKKKKKEKKPPQKTDFYHVSHFHPTVDARVIRVRLCAGDLELVLPCGRHYKYSC